MTTTNYFYSIAIFSLAFPCLLFAQTWEHKSPGNNPVHDLYIKNNAIYAGVEGTSYPVSTLFRSINQGENWDSLTSGDYLIITSIISIEDTLFFGTHRFGFYRSTDNGVSWQEKVNGLPDMFAMDALALDHNNKLIAGGDGAASSGVSRTDDNAETWYSINNGIPNTTWVRQIEKNNSGHLFVLSWDRIWRSTDNASSWTELQNGLPSPFSIGGLAVNSAGDLFLGFGDTVFFSNDKGDTWTSLFGFSDNVGIIKIDTVSGSIYAVVGDNAVYRSSDNGANWTNLNNGLPNTFINSMEINSGGSVYLGTLHGIYMFVPAISVGLDVTLCFSDSAQLNASGGTSYSWNPTTGLSCSNCPNPRVSSMVTTDYIVTVTNGSNSETDTVRVTVNSLPDADAGSDAAICFGSGINLSASGGNSYSWTPSAGLNNPDIANPFANPSSTTPYTVTVTDANGCSATAEVTITVNSLPSVSFSGLESSYCITDPAVTLNGSPSGGIYNGLGIHGDQFVPFNAGTGNHTITYVYTDGNNCTDSPSQLVMVNVCAGVNEIAFIKEFSLSPNPSGGNFTLEFFLLERSNLDFSIINLFGQEVLTGRLEQFKGNFKQEIDLSGHASGIYLLTIKSARGVMRKKMIVEK